MQIENIRNQSKCQDAIFDKIFLDFSQKSVFKWIEIKWIKWKMDRLDRIGLGFYT